MISLIDFLLLWTIAGTMLLPVTGRFLKRRLR